MIAPLFKDTMTNCTKTIINKRQTIDEKIIWNIYNVLVSNLSFIMLKIISPIYKYNEINVDPEINNSDLSYKSSKETQK